MLPVADATVNLFVLTSKLPSIPTAPLALIAAAVVVPATLNVLSRVVAPVTSNVPAISILSASLALVTASLSIVQELPDTVISPLSPLATAVVVTLGNSSALYLI